MPSPINPQKQVHGKPRKNKQIAIDVAHFKNLTVPDGEPKWVVEPKGKKGNKWVVVRYGG